MLAWDVAKRPHAESHLRPGRYFNWDYDDDRRALLNKQWRNSDLLLIFDELHKYPQWKSWIKGLYDVQGQQHQILVAGSARLGAPRRLSPGW